MTDRIYLSSPDVTESEASALLRALRSGWVAPLGPEVDAFEAELAEFVGRRFAVALSSGTAALHLGLLTLGVTPGSVVITSTLTFAATANAVMYCGATPVFVDSDFSGNLDPCLLDTAVKDQLGGGAKISAILPVDLLGKIADHRAIGALAEEHAVPLFVDAAESLGATRSGERAGESGVASAVSFNGNKVMTTSGGGAFLCDDETLASRVRYLATQARQPYPYYEHVDVGFNYRLSNLLAGLGRAQLERLPKMIDRRREWRRRYRALFAAVPGTEIFGGSDGFDDADNHDNFWLTSLLVDPEVAGWTGEDLRLYLATLGIEARPLWKPMHLQPVFAGFPAYINGTSDHFFRTGISLPSGSVLTLVEFERVVTAITDFVHGVHS